MATFLNLPHILLTRSGPYSCRFYSSSSFSTALKKFLYGDNTNCSNENNILPSPTSSSPRKASNEEVENHLKGLALELFPNHLEEWITINISNLQLKSKVLCNCEQHLMHKVPNRALGTIHTLGDLKTFFNTPPPKPPGVLFSDLRQKIKDLPTNLSVELPPPAKRKSVRQPFQDYDDLRCPNKKQRQHIKR